MRPANSCRRSRFVVNDTQFESCCCGCVRSPIQKNVRIVSPYLGYRIHIRGCRPWRSRIALACTIGQIPTLNGYRTAVCRPTSHESAVFGRTVSGIDDHSYTKFLQIVCRYCSRGNHGGRSVCGVGQRQSRSRCQDVCKHRNCVPVRVDRNVRFIQNTQDFCANVVVVIIRIQSYRHANSIVVCSKRNSGYSLTRPVKLAVQILGVDYFCCPVQNPNNFSSTSVNKTRQIIGAFRNLDENTWGSCNTVVVERNRSGVVSCGGSKRRRVIRSAISRGPKIFHIGFFVVQPEKLCAVGSCLPKIFGFIPPQKHVRRRTSFNFD